MFSDGSSLRVFVAIVLASGLVTAGLVHVSFAEIQIAGGNNNNNSDNNNNNTYSNLQFGIENIEFPNGWARTVQEQNSTAGTPDEITITLKLENATGTTTQSSSPPGVANPFSLFSSFSSPTNGNISSSLDNDNNNGAAANDPFSPTITIKLQKGDALQRQLATEQNQTEGQEIDLFAQNPYCKPLNPNDDNGTGNSGNNNNNTAIINGHNFTVTEQECDMAPILKLFLGAFFAGFANLANNNTNLNNNNSSSILDNNNTANGSSGTNTTGTNQETTTANSASTTNTTTATGTDADKIANFLDTLHNITTTEKRYTYTSASSNLRVELSYSALTFVSIEDFEIKAKHYQRYLPVFENIVHSVKIQQEE
ncbi:hypothetical protein NTE_00543 [Candidatus Nitrososphaera evergladensis SR1]|uniref:Uncharacterized protein n=1 Tax=Candidatus Nitrososphaera evergladensis SR1 TaxID=1459636 RepID=A0A075MTK7_9ARCH|nr:hypothetical protein [Candidatus Nitrososphaera evergladensis]AIF82624.1 hypothetical protein NTE_00543 [Candidatus Nitrososphaera evergladensis SR1]